MFSRTIKVLKSYDFRTFSLLLASKSSNYFSANPAKTTLTHILTHNGLSARFFSTELQVVAVKLQNPGYIYSFNLTPHKIRHRQDSSRRCLYLFYSFCSLPPDGNSCVRYAAVGCTV